MKVTKLSCFVSLCSIFCLMLFVQSANAQSRSQETDTDKNTGSATQAPDTATFGAAPGGAGVAERDQKLKDAIRAAIQTYNTEQKNFGYEPLCSDADLKNVMSGDFVTKFKGFLTGKSTIPATQTKLPTTTTVSSEPKVEIKNNGPGTVTLAFGDGRIEQIAPKESKVIEGVFPSTHVHADDNWTEIEIVVERLEFSFMDGDDQKTYDLKPGESFKRELQKGKKHYVLQPK